MPTYEITAEPGSHLLTMTATITGRRDLVFKAYTDPAAIPQWWGLDANSTVVDRMDAVRGGSWRFLERSPEGEEHAFRGVYHDVVPDERIVWTFEYEPWPGHVLLEEMLFLDQGERTRIEVRSVFQTVEDRDGMIATGMEEGANQSLNRLEAYVSAQR
ncbi:MAG TPA: SRPBCC domain-containing protein [Tepidiformaceae bacterium]|nr:SRPBCC domain-containing protein [Tepidiformaceae bacterium]